MSVTFDLDFQHTVDLVDPDNSVKTTAASYSAHIHDVGGLLDTLDS